MNKTNEKYLFFLLKKKEYCTVLKYMLKNRGMGSSENKEYLGTMYLLEQ